MPTNTNERSHRMPKKSKHICLRCDREFMSGGIWNRICPNCRVSNESIVDINHRDLRGNRIKRADDKRELAYK
jgi:hypothetical protein